MKLASVVYALIVVALIALLLYVPNLPNSADFAKNWLPIIAFAVGSLVTVAGQIIGRFNNFIFVSDALRGRQIDQSMKLWDIYYAPDFFVTRGLVWELLAEWKRDPKCLDRWMPYFFEDYDQDAPEVSELERRVEKLSKVQHLSRFLTFWCRLAALTRAELADKGLLYRLKLDYFSLREFFTALQNACRGYAADRPQYQMPIWVNDLDAVETFWHT